MNFADILDQWDDLQKSERVNKRKNVEKKPQVSHKKANAPTKEEKKMALALKKSRLSPEEQMEEESKVKINPMEAWLRRYGTVDKDKLNDEYEENNRMRSREYLKNLRAEARLDLHGLTRDEAWGRLTEFTNDAIRRGFKKVEFVHGKGIHSHGTDPVLGETVRTFIEQNPHLGTSGHPDKNHGGTGVTWVLLK